jgi:hypothetical protein
MFNNNTDFQIHNSTLYNVAGDINLQSHLHLTIRDYHAAFRPPAGTRGLEDGLAGSHPHLTIHDHELHGAGFQPPAALTLGLEEGQLEGSQHEWAGAVRSARHGMAARAAPYGAPKLP